MTQSVTIKLSDYVADFIANLGVEKVFAISGGASLHLIHSIANHRKLDYVCTHHEQAAAMAADGYSRCTGKFGVAIATSGPGATNLITGICCSFYDSVPTLLITGQVSTFRMTGETGVRQIGFQETPITKITKPITKYSSTITKATNIKYELEKAVYLAKSGRPGPVLIDIPDNIQRELINPQNLPSFKKDSKLIKKTKNEYKEIFKKFLNLLKKSKRPLVIGGWGLHLSSSEKQFINFIEKFNLPAVFTWGASDLLNDDHKLYIGTFGTHGMRHANFAVQNADLIISFGSRLDTKATGTPIDTFARGAKKIVIDIDPYELKKFAKFGLNIDLLIEEDLGEFFVLLEKEISLKKPIESEKWLKTINHWKKNLKPEEEVNNLSLNPYELFPKITNFINPKANIFIDTGCSIAWAMQTMSFAREQRVFHDFNNTAMGWALPASIGSFFANKNNQIVCITGDGSLMMSIQELATIKHHKIPIKIILINNSGYSMIQQTQDQWLSSKYIASSKNGGLSFPSYSNLAKSYDLEYFKLENEDSAEIVLNDFFKNKLPSFLNVKIPSEARVSPQVKFGRPNEDMEPLLPRDLFLDNMIIDPLDVSIHNKDN